MIINYPTGLYKNVLPKGVNAGNITYEVSSNSPPSISPFYATKLPIEYHTNTSDKIFTQSERREQFGELVFTIAEASAALTGSNIKAFEVGEILQFEDEPPTSQINPPKAPNNLEIRHDTNILDLEAAGLTRNEIDLLIKQSEAKQEQLEIDYSNAKIEISNLDILIKENQKKINETNKAIRATRIVFDIPENDFDYDNDIYQKLLANLENLMVEKDNLISSRNIANDELTSIFNSLIKVSELVR